MDATFEDEDIFKQFDLQPTSPTKTSSTTTSSNLHIPRQNVSKTEILEILKIVESSLERTWMLNCGGKKRRLHKLETLKELKAKIESCPEEMNLSLVMEHAMAPTSCVPPLFGRNPNKIVEQQLTNTLEFLEGHMNTEIGGGEESDNATIGGSIAENDDELEMMSAHSHFSYEESTNSSVYTEANYDADSEKGFLQSSGDLSEDSAGDINDVVLTTCNVENDLGPLGVSITTWSRRKINGESIRSRTTAQLVAEAEATSDSDDDEDDGEEEEEQTVEEVQVAIGKLVVHATRSRSVRFSGVKPTTEDNISRAMELLRNAKMMRKKMNESSSE